LPRLLNPAADIILVAPGMQKVLFYTMVLAKVFGWQGFWMALKRLLRCHPWSRGGYDPVLPNDEKL